MATAVYRGSIEELQGQKFEVPDGLNGRAALEWIEGEHEKQQQAAAKAKRQAEKRTVAITPAPTTLDQERLSALEAELQLLRDAEGPDALRVAEVASTAALLVDRQHQLNAEARQLQESMVEPLKIAQELVAKAEEQLSAAQRIKEETLAVLKVNQQTSNLAFNSYAKQLQEFRKDLTEAQYEFSELNRETRDVHKNVKSSLELTETAVNAGREAASEAVDKGMDDFLAFMSLTVRALGLNESDINQQLNSANVTAGNAWLTREFLAKAAELMRSWEQQPAALADVVSAEEAISPNPGPQLQG